MFTGVQSLHNWNWINIKINEIKIQHYEHIIYNVHTSDNFYFITTFYVAFITG